MHECCLIIFAVFAIFSLMGQSARAVIALKNKSACPALKAYILRIVSVSPSIGHLKIFVSCGISCSVPSVGHLILMFPNITALLTICADAAGSPVPPTELLFCVAV